MTYNESFREQLERECNEYVQREMEWMSRVLSRAQNK